ncbi:glycoside hydrolase, partial [Thozetella sp. PMI_491]
MYKSIALAALSAIPALASPAVNVYFGQSGFNRLSSYCQQDGFEYITLAFVNNSPEQDDSGLNYPGTNFGAHCSGDVYINSANDKASKLLSGCSLIAEDIPVCQALGKKVLLSIGGAWIDGTNYTVTGTQRGQDFAKFLWGAFGPYSSTWTGPRPFDINGPKVSVDGFDFDIEHTFADQTGYVALLTTLRSLTGSKYLITGAPQCPISSGNDMATMISSVAFDALFIQFYNNPVCDGIPNNTPGDSFNFDDWVTFIGKGASKNAKLFIGLPGAPPAAGSTETGYLEPAAAISLINQYKTSASFGGVMIWDVDTGSAKTSSGRTYYQAIHDAV